MSPTPDISAIIVFHREGLIVPASIRSLEQCVSAARHSGLTVECIAVVDRPDDLTLKLVRHHESYFDMVVVVDFGDLGLSRNAGCKASTGRRLAFFDGDDLWGEDWLRSAHRKLEALGGLRAIVHPELIFYFNKIDYLSHSRSSVASPNAQTFFMAHPDSASLRFSPEVLVINNVWTANNMAPREIFEEFPYQPVVARTGFGVEDWAWNVETLCAGLRHTIAPDTVHCIRIKDVGSLGVQNSTTGVIPAVHRFAEKLSKI